MGKQSRLTHRNSDTPVLRDSPVSFAMALLESLSRSFMRLTLPIISMVITLLYLLKYSAGQWNTLVNFGAALLALDGQFSVGVNNRYGLSTFDQPYRFHFEFQRVSGSLPRFDTLANPARQSDSGAAAASLAGPNSSCLIHGHNHGPEVKMGWLRAYVSL